MSIGRGMEGNQPNIVIVNSPKDINGFPSFGDQFLTMGLGGDLSNELETRTVMVRGGTLREIIFEVQGIVAGDQVYRVTVKKNLLATTMTIDMTLSFGTFFMDTNPVRFERLDIMDIEVEVISGTTGRIADVMMSMLIEYD